MRDQDVNSNDNHVAGQLYREESDCLVHKPATQYLIKKYINAYWKNEPNSIEYVDMELTLARYLLTETYCDISRNLKIKWIARVLGVNPLLLLNDPALPF